MSTITIYKNISFSIAHTHKSAAQGGDIPAADLHDEDVTLLHKMYNKSPNLTAANVLDRTQNEIISGNWTIPLLTVDDLYTSAASGSPAIRCGGSNRTGGERITEIESTGSQTQISFWKTNREFSIFVRDANPSIVYIDAGDASSPINTLSFTGWTTISFNDAEDFTWGDTAKATIRIDTGTNVAEFEFWNVAVQKFGIQLSTSTEILFNLLSTMTSIRINDATNTPYLDVGSSAATMYSFRALASSTTSCYMGLSLAGTLQVYIGIDSSDATTVDFIGGGGVTTLGFGGALVTFESLTLTSISFENANAVLIVGDSDANEYALEFEATSTTSGYMNIKRAATKLVRLGVDTGTSTTLVLQRMNILNAFTISTFTTVTIDTATLFHLSAAITSMQLGLDGSTNNTIFFDINSSTDASMDFRYNSTRFADITMTDNNGSGAGILSINGSAGALICNIDTFTTFSVTAATTINMNAAATVNFTAASNFNLTNSTSRIYVGTAGSSNYSLLISAITSGSVNFAMYLNGTLKANIGLNSIRSDAIVFTGTTGIDRAHFNDGHLDTIVVPTGTGTGPSSNNETGQMYYDATNNKIGVYDGSWLYTAALT